VALTGRSRRLAEEAVDAGASSYVLKPFAGAEVVGKLLDAIADHESRGVRAAREQSREALAELLALLGRPAEWAVDLERRAYERGTVWRRVDRTD
jgi:CheY-like chemotaxis protein